MNVDFPLMLLTATAGCGVIWGGYVLYSRTIKTNRETEPYLVGLAHSFFPVLLIVLVLRSFVAEPFRIPSASMMPTLLIGDFILVNKFIYGLRLPVFHSKIIAISEPQRGDIVVFRFPRNPQIDYIKRIVGVGGDKIRYQNKKVFVNGILAVQSKIGVYNGVGQGTPMTGFAHLTEDLNGAVHQILIKNGHPSVEDVFVVPQNSYFVMGDNRDGSSDSRYWGVVPEANLVGKAFFVWMNWDWQHQGIGFDRIGVVPQ